jgi:glycosyltransferase involved in cell wall biosynthesis
MANELIVSIIMPSFNTRIFIQEAIESVLAQTYAHWELLLIDDGSNDGSTEIALQYARQYPERIHYLEHEEHQNRGASASRNLGFRNMKGSYIAFLDSDDVWLPTNLENFVKVLDENPQAAMAYGATQWWYSWTGKAEDLDRDYIQGVGVKINKLFQPPQLFVPIFLLQEAAVPCTCSLLLRKDILKDIGIFEERFRYIYTDQVFYAKVFLNVPVIATDYCGAKYRQHSNSSCAKVENLGQASAARLNFLTWLEEYLSEQGLRNSVIWKHLQYALMPYRNPHWYSFSRKVSKLSKLARQTIMPTRSTK